MKKVFLLLVILIVVVGITVPVYAYDPMSGDQQDNDYAKPSKKSSPAPEAVYAPYTGPKKRVAVTKFDNKVKGTYGSWNIGEGMAEQLTTALIKTGRFVVVERQALQDVLGEQELGQTGVIKKETAAKVGQVLGAQIIVRGVVSEFEQAESGGGSGIGIGGFRIGGRSSNAHVGIDIRLIDATSGQVLTSHNAVGKVESSGVAFGVSRGIVDFGADSFKNAPIGQATRQAIEDAVKFIVDTMETVPFTAKVVKIEGKKIYINIGSNMNIRSGTKMYAYALGEDLVDPDTGLRLGADEKLLGTVEVRDVQSKFSIGYMVSGNGPLKRGDVLKLP
ncbi:MAG: CsgG/HfaB family protein [Thermodesulfovibrionales bacterium]